MEYRLSQYLLIPLVVFATISCVGVPAWSDDATNQYKIASGFFNMNRFDFAAEEYEKFLNAYPKHELAADALYFLGESQYQLDQIDPARKTFRDCVTRFPNSPNYFYALYRLGETSHLLGDYASAEPALSEFVARRPSDPLLEYALPDLGRVQLSAGKSKEAKATLRKSIEKFPKGKLFDRSQYDLARALEQLNEMDSAIELYRALAANSSSKLAVDAQLALGIRLFEDKNYERSLEAFEALEQRFPQSALVTTAKLNHGLCLYQLQRYDEALAVLESQAQGDSSEVPEAWYWLGMTQEARGTHETAAETLLAGYAKFGSDKLAPEMLFHAAQAMFRAAQFGPAQDRFLELLRTFPKHDLADDSLYHAAESARAADQHERVLALARQFYKEFPQSALTHRMVLAVAQSLIALNRYDEAADQLADLLARRPDSAVAVPARYYRAEALRAAGRIDDALTALEPLLAGQSKDPAIAQVLADAQFLNGSCYFQKKDYARAVAPLRNYLAMRPDGDVAGHALSYLAVCLAALGDYDQLRGTLDTLRSKAAQELSLPAIYQVAEACYEARQYALAGDLYAEVAQKETRGSLHAKALSGLAWARYEAEQYGQAAKFFAQLVEGHPDDSLAAEASYMLGRALEADSKRDQAIAAYKSALARYPQAPQAFDAGLQLARALHQAGKIQQAALAYEDLSRRFPGANGLDVAIYEWALLLQSSGEEAEAQQIFQRLATEFPDSALVPAATLSLGEALFQSRQYAEVIARLAPLLSKELTANVREAVIYQLGRAQVESAAWQDAHRSFELLAQEFPTSPRRREAEFWIAETDRQQDQPKAAADRLARLVAEPVEPEPWLGTAWLHLAQCQGELKKWKEVLATVEQLKRRFPKFELMNEADYHSGRALQNLARFDDARAAYRRAIAGQPDENAAKSQFMIGETYFHQKQYREALREFLKVEILYAFPQWQAAALLEAAKCHEYLQEWSRAVEIYKRILEKYPNTDHVAEATQRLRSATSKLTTGTSSKKGVP